MASCARNHWLGDSISSGRTCKLFWAFFVSLVSERSVLLFNPIVDVAGSYWSLVEFFVLRSCRTIVTWFTREAELILVLVA